MTIADLNSKLWNIKIYELPEYLNNQVKKENNIENIVLWNPLYEYSQSIFSADLSNCLFQILPHGRFSYRSMHSHNYFEMMYIYHGHITHEIDDQRITLNKGDIIFLNPYVSHAVQPAFLNDIGINFLFSPELFSPDFLEKIAANSLISDFLLSSLNLKNEKFLIIRSQKNEELHLLIQKILIDWYNPDLCTIELLTNLIPVLFDILYRIYRAGRNDRSPRLNPSDNVSQIIASILRYIENNAPTVTLTEIAERFGYSYSYVSTLLSEYTNKQFINLKQDAQLKLAAELLTGTNDKVDVIINQVGYQNKSHFYQLFREKYKMSPAGFRKLYQLTPETEPSKTSQK